MDGDQDETSQNENNRNSPINQNRGSVEQASSSRGASVDELRSQASRTRRLVSQSTFHENDLDNSVLNSQQQFVDLSEDDSDDEDHDQLFEEYMRQNAEVARNQACEFDVELPMNHSYLGETDVVRGTNCYESGKIYEIPVFGHHSMVFPGEIFPMIVTNDGIFARSPESNEGLTFGVVFTDEASDSKLYGVTCHVFEKGLDVNGHITVKSKADQRFVVVKSEDGYATTRNQNYFAKIKILPEYQLPEPINLSISNNMMKFLQNPSQANKLKTLLTSFNRWPQFVYDQYTVVIVNEKVERFLAMLNISSVPSEPVLRSFWLARNIPLNSADRLKIFTSNCVNKRMLLIGQSLNYMCYFDCKRCKTRIASYSDIFAMAKGNVNANYCNPAGYIHETLTVNKTVEKSVSMVDRPSTDFSWFPGYAWQIAVCSKCSSHIGWKFVAVTKNLKPKAFFGLSCKSLVVSPKKETSDKNESHSDSSDDN